MFPYDVVQSYRVPRLALDQLARPAGAVHRRVDPLPRPVVNAVADPQVQVLAPFAALPDVDCLPVARLVD